jgi:hypothetical protein
VVGREKDPLAGQPQKRMKRRELERRRREQRKLIIIVATLAVAGSAVGAAIVLSPPPPLPHGIQPGEIVSNNPMHIHTKLIVVSDGTERIIPSNIGIQQGIWASHDLDHFLDTREGAQGQLSPLHTHDSSGLIHVEASVTRGFTLGEFFAVWGQPLGPNQVWDLVADQHHQLSLKVDGNPAANWENIVLRDGMQVVITSITV